MDTDIQFGDVEEAAPQPRLRPDQNKHFAVVVCGTPGQNDLPIFVDLDTMRDMEAHALTDTGVELGGVMLGGQHEDDQGQPFVLVSDSLRAAHYESTKGSFKFTHDTWSEITRERDEFPEDLQMVGWYHTHPDWGVFLSGMDMFICDNFFNKPLDVALVIDPCRDDRGLFQWTGNPRERVRRTGGFYLIASRFRRDELEMYAAQLEGKLPMAADPRIRSMPSSINYPQPVIHISESRATWQAVAVIGMLTMQFLLLGLLTWRILLPAEAPREQPVSEARQLAAEREMLDRIIGKLQIAPEGLVSELNNQQRSNDQLQAANLGLHAEIMELQKFNETAVGEQRKLLDQLALLRKDFQDLKGDNKQQRAQIAELEKSLQAAGAPVAGTTNWTLIIGGVVLFVLAGAGAAIVFSMRGPLEERTESAADSEVISDSAEEFRPPGPSRESASDDDEDRATTIE
jgi:proteasome lid subunit RPN8/RPN11